jgi:hypothetical protein
MNKPHNLNTKQAETTYKHKTNTEECEGLLTAFKS